MELLESILAAIERNPNLSLIIGLVLLLLFGVYVIVPLAKPLINAVTSKSGTDSEVLGTLSDIANERLESIEKKLDAYILQNATIINRFDALVKASQAQVVTLEAAYDKLNKEFIGELTRHEYRTKQRYEGVETFFKQIETFIKDTKAVINFLAIEIRSPERGKDTEPVLAVETTVTIVKDAIPDA